MNLARTTTSTEFRIQNSEFRILNSAAGPLAKPHGSLPDGRGSDSAFRIPHSAFTRPRSAFTLIELLVVIGIIGILIAILLPTMSYVKIQAKKAATASLMASIGTGLEQYYSDFNTFPVSNITAANYPQTVPFNRGSLMLAEAMTGYLPGNIDGAGPPTYTSDPGFGFRIRANGVGKIYGPYMPPTGSNWKVVDTKNNYYAFIDSWGNEILYYRAVPTIISGQTRTTSISKVFDSLGTNSAMNFDAYFNSDDNSQTTYANGSAIADPSSASAKFFPLIGAASNTLAGGESLTGKDSYLLLSAGPDGNYFTSDDVVAGGK